MAMNDLDLDFANTCEAIVKESRRITPKDTDEVRHIALSIDEPSFRYVEGQNIGVLVPGPHPFGNKYHHRFYSIANSRSAKDEEILNLEILVRRCFYIDEVSGERYPGIASNYLCDARAGDKVTITGPYRSPFKLPKNRHSNLLMVGTGTGIAPFRAFIQHIYGQKPAWEGQIRLFYGARSGMDLYYMNDVDNDLTNYYDKDTFKAFQAVSERPLAQDGDALEQTLEENAAVAWSLMQDPDTYVYLAGLTKAADAFEKVMSKAAGSTELWENTKQQMIDEERWSKLIYQ